MQTSNREIQEAIFKAFALGWEVGKYEGANSPVSLNELLEKFAFEFAERDRLAQKFASTEQPK